MSSFDDSCERGEGNHRSRRGEQASPVERGPHCSSTANTLTTPTDHRLAQNDSAHMESGVAGAGDGADTDGILDHKSAFSQYLGQLTPNMPFEIFGQLFDEQRDKDAGAGHPAEGVVPPLQLPITDDGSHASHTPGRDSRLRQHLRRLAHRDCKNLHRKLFVASINRWLRDEYPTGSWVSKLQDRLFIASIRAFDFFTPSRRAGHLIWLTWTTVSITMVVFAFMAGAFPFYRFQKGYEGDVGTLGWGPDELWDWATVRDNTTQFDFDFLLAWGGRYLPNVEEGESYRWFTSLLLHQSFVHLMSNALIFLALGSYLEYKYGSMRVAAAITLAGLGGNFLSAVAEDRCSIVVGASGVVFGFMGFGMVDLVLNREVVLHVAARLAISILFVTFIVMTLILEEYSSHISHAGGFLCGFLPALLFAPDLKYERLEAMIVWAVAGFIVLGFTLLPTVVYYKVLPNLEC